MNKIDRDEDDAHVIAIYEAECKKKDKEIAKLKDVLAWADEELSRLKSGKESQFVDEINKKDKRIRELEECLSALFIPCPVCKGTGSVEFNFYRDRDYTQIASNETCRTCNGTTYISIKQALTK
jgi:hypothetical protein